MRKQKANKIIVTFVGFVLLLLCTYFRENILLEINANLALAENNRSYKYWFSGLFKNMPTDMLVKFKWGVTLLFSIVMPIITIGTLYVWFKSIDVLRISGLFFLVLLIVVFIFAFGGYMFNSFGEVYFVLRKILGVVQSPLPFFALFTLFYWNFKN